MEWSVPTLDTIYIMVFFFKIRAAVCSGNLWVRFNQKYMLLGLLVFVEQDLVVHISTVLQHFLLPFSFNFTLCSDDLQ